MELHAEQEGYGMGSEVRGQGSVLHGTWVGGLARTSPLRARASMSAGRVSNSA